jgi:hypothetical protein
MSKLFVRALISGALSFTVLAAAHSQPTGQSCGELIRIATHAATTTHYALAHPPGTVRAHAVVVLLAGGGGHVDLDAQGCARALQGNFLVRSQALFHTAGFITALADAPSDHPGDEGLAGFRIDSQHAEDLGKLIADLRARTKLPVWVVGTSRGTISAVNAAARLTGASAPDGVVITSVLSVGGGGKRGWVRQSVYDLRLEDIHMPVLLVGHADDSCLRSPAAQMAKVAARLGAKRKQVVTVTGGSGTGAHPSIEDCQGRSPHGFIGQEAEVIDGIARFIRGERY